jgi:hypothetical protein
MPRNVSITLAHTLQKSFLFLLLRRPPASASSSLSLQLQLPTILLRALRLPLRLLQHLLEARHPALAERAVQARVLRAQARDLRPELRVLDPEPFDDGPALFPPPVRFVGGGEGGVQELGARLELLDVSILRVGVSAVSLKRRGKGERGEKETDWSRRSRNARCALRFCSARLLVLSGRLFAGSPLSPAIPSGL